MKYLKNKALVYTISIVLCIGLLIGILFFFKKQLLNLTSKLGLTDSKEDTHYIKETQSNLDKIDKSIPTNQLTRGLDHLQLANDIYNAMDGLGTDETPFYKLKTSFTIADRTKIITCFGVKKGEKLRNWIENEYSLNIRIREGKTHAEWLKQFFSVSNVY